MKPSEIFGLVIRCVGLILTLIGFYKIYTAVIFLVQTHQFLLYSILLGIPCLLLGVWFLSGAKQLVFFSYPETMTTDPKFVNVLKQYGAKE